MHVDNPIEGSDSAIYPELSRANLLRMRGDYKGAEEQCLAILRRYPNNATVHTLLGDIHAEQDNLEQAADWYELALDINPHSATDRQKLLAVQERQRMRDAASNAQALGLPDDRQKLPLYATVAVVTILLVGVLAFFMGQNAQGRNRSAINMPVSAPSQGNASQEFATSNAEVGSQQIPMADRELMNLVRQRSQYAGHLVSLQTDPRSRAVSVTFAVGQNEDERRVAAEIARSILDQSPEAVMVIVRGVRNDQVAFMADAPRSRYTEIQSGAYSSPEDAWIGHMLTNVWPSDLRIDNTPPAPVPMPSMPRSESIPPPAETPSNPNSPGPEFLPPLDRD